MYQKCPVCNGAGKFDDGGECDVCKGEKIIHQEKGLPPSALKETISVQPWHPHDIVGPGVINTPLVIPDKYPEFPSPHPWDPRFFRPEITCGTEVVLGDSNV